MLVELDLEKLAQNMAESISEKITLGNEKEYKLEQSRTSINTFVDVACALPHIDDELFKNKILFGLERLTEELIDDDADYQNCLTEIKSFIIECLAPKQHQLRM